METEAMKVKRSDGRRWGWTKTGEGGRDFHWTLVEVHLATRVERKSRIIQLATEGAREERGARFHVHSSVPTTFFAHQVGIAFSLPWSTLHYCSTISSFTSRFDGGNARLPGRHTLILLHESVTNRLLFLPIFHLFVPSSRFHQQKEEEQVLERSPLSFPPLISRKWWNRAESLTVSSSSISKYSRESARKRKRERYKEYKILSPYIHIFLKFSVSSFDRSFPNSSFQS